MFLSLRFNHICTRKFTYFVSLISQHVFITRKPFDTLHLSNRGARPTFDLDEKVMKAEEGESGSHADDKGRP